MAKKIKIAVLAAIVLLAISGAAFARGGHDGNRGCYPARYYRPAYRRDCRPVYRPVYSGYGYCPRPVYMYPRSGIIISTGSIIIGLGF